MTLTQILTELSKEQEIHSKGQTCKFCNTALAVVKETPTIVHLRNPVTQEVRVEQVYSGKYLCQMCHKYQA